MSSVKPLPVSIRESDASVVSDGKSRVSSLSSGHSTSRGLDGFEGKPPCQSHFGQGSTYSDGVGRGNIASHGCSCMHIGGAGYARRMSTGDCLGGGHGDCPSFGHDEGPAEVSAGIACEMGGYPVACGIIFSSVNEKGVMQNLNDRLASYIDKLRCLEAENAKLKVKITNFYAKEGPIGEWKDYSHNYHQIEELKKQIIQATVENNKILLKIDSDHMNVEEVTQKLETESAAGENMEADLSGLRSVLEELVSCKCNLEAELESLQEELNGLKKDHEEKIIHLERQPLEVSMEVSICPGPDLKKILHEMRCKYEAMIDSNHKQVAQWYETKSVFQLEKVNQEICSSSQEVEEGNHKAMNLKRQLQALETDLQSQCKMKETLEESLAEVECRYQAQLAEMQDQTACLELQLAELRLEIKSQDEGYKALLDAKHQLEQEIQTYHSLLEGGQEGHVDVEI